MLIAIIPARGGSKRIKSKNIVDFCGRPLIDYSLRAAKESAVFDVIHVSTESAEIKAVVETCGLPVDFMRDPKLADDHTGLAPVLKWTLEEYERRGRHFDEVCLLMPTAPLLLAKDLVAGYELFKSRGAQTAVLAASRFPVPVEWAFHRDDQGLLHALMPDKLTVRSQDLEPTYYDAGVFGFFPRSHFEGDPPSFGSTFLAYELPRARAVDIDDEEDLELAKSLYRGAQASTMKS